MSTTNRHAVDKVKHSSEISSEDIFEAIHTVMHLVRSRQYRVLRDCPYDLTHMEGKILGFFARHPGGTLSELAAHTGRDKGQLARIIKTLRTHDLLSAAGDPADKRSVKLQLTREGAKVRTILQAELKEATELAVRGLNADEREQLAQLLHRLRANIEAAG